MKVRLEFSVSENALPALFIIRSFDGRLILYKRVYRRQNFLCFCTKSRNLIITVRPYNAEFYEKSYFLKFGCRPCVNLRLDFNFTAVSAERLQTFCLFDENYSFPITRAVLSFCSVYKGDITP
ncbi:MAG: hypothetical protein IJU83_01340 [Clostridia bacterium]|nr:hypothetical protein [Clostridia bacterium]